MKDETFEVIVCSLPHRERPVAEVYYNNIQWVEISQEADELVVHFCPHPEKKYWEFSLDEAIKILEKAKKQLLGN